MLRRMLILCAVFTLLTHAALGEDESVFVTPPPTKAPLLLQYEIAPEIQVTSSLLLLEHPLRPITTWDDPVYIEGGMRVPVLYQNDFQTVVCEYDGEARSVATSGCSLTCLSMALYYLLEDATQDPTSLFREACLNRMYVGNGIKQTDLVALAAMHGAKGVRCGGTRDNITQALQKGYPIIAATKEGTFGNGHYILLRGLNDEGDLYVNDPNSVEHSETTFTFRQVLTQLKGSMPLTVIMPEDGFMVIAGVVR